MDFDSDRLPRPYDFRVLMSRRMLYPATGLRPPDFGAYYAGLLASSERRSVPPGRDELLTASGCWRGQAGEGRCG